MLFKWRSTLFNLLLLLRWRRLQVTWVNFCVKKPEILIKQEKKMVFNWMKNQNQILFWYQNKNVSNSLSLSHSLFLSLKESLTQVSRFVNFWMSLSLSRLAYSLKVKSSSGFYSLVAIFFWKGNKTKERRREREK